MALDELSYVALNKLSYMAPSDSELRGSLIYELLGSFFMIYESRQAENKYKNCYLNESRTIALY